MTRVQGHWRKTKSGKRTWIKPYNRGRGGIRKIPITVSNPSLKRSSAEYDPLSKSSLISVVDEDPDKTTTLMIETPMKVESVHVDEHGNIGLGISAKTKKKTDRTTVMIETPIQEI